MKFPGSRGRASTLRTRLAALALIPLIGLGGFAGAAIAQRAGSAADAQRAENLLTGAARLSDVRGDLLRELVPSMAFTIVQNPALAQSIGVSAVSVDDLGLSAAKVGALRGQTDRAIATLARDDRSRRLAGSVRASVQQLRKDVDSGIGIQAGYDIADTVIGRLTAAQNADIAGADRANLVGAANVAARDLERATLVVQLGDQELPLLAGSLFPVLGGSGAQAAQSSVAEFLSVWGGYRAAYDDLAEQAADPLADALKRATGTASARAFDNTISQLAAHPSSIGPAVLVELYRSGEQRSAALGKVLDLAVERTMSAVAAQRRASVDSLIALAVVVAAVLIASLVIGWRVFLSVARPLRDLAASANKVSEGVLDDVVVDGPREVRTAARGLAAAVANLRNIEAQASAVATGDLDSEVLRRPLPGPLGEIVHASVETIVGAIHERDEAQSDLAYRAAHDPLTELPNRAQAMALIEQSLHRARRSGVMTGLMFVDLDHFKSVNDTLGHEAGDGVLVACAERMTSIVRGGDTVARLGGDEFVILLEDITDETDVVRLAERVVAALAEPVQVFHRQVRIGASIGVTICNDGYVDAGRLLREADAAAYRAKNAGRGRYDVFDDALREELARRAELDVAIADGLRRGEFVLYYQPVVDLSTGRPRGVEALIRWNRPGCGLVSPDEFIPAAELSTLINDIGRWTLHEAAAQLARWDAQLGPKDLTVGVNISGRYLCSDDFVDDVRHAVETSGIEPSRLTVELTETVLVENLTAATTMGKLRDLGVQVAIDDFGTGFTSVSQLLGMPIDTLKIDRSFVASSHPTSRELVHLMTRAAHAFGLRVVAEGVEEAGQIANLAECAVEAAQGYHFARPQSADEALALIRMPVLPVRLAG
jgi:diguanylate cyclase (GGDEF)-like protein